MEAPPRAIPPERIVGAGLVLRAWDESLAESMKDAIDSSLAELGYWMDWVPNGPADLEGVRDRLSRGREAFFEGRDFLYAVMAPDEREVVGSIGLHRRGGAQSLEVGYWIRTDRTGRGIGTEATRTLTRVAIRVLGVQTVVIKCDPLNTRSAAIPRRLGYRLVEVLEDETTNPRGELRDTMVWELSAARFDALESSAPE